MQIFDPAPESRPESGEAPRSAPVRLPRRATRGLPALLHRPLTWAIAAESALAVAFTLAALHLLASSPGVATAAAPLLPPASRASPGAAFEQWPPLQAFAGALRTYVEDELLPALEQAAGARTP